MKRRLGISLYPDHTTYEQDKAYIDLAHTYGFERIFMCLLSATKPKTEIQQEYSKIIAYAKNLGFEVILDVAPNTFESLNISYDNLEFFHHLNASGIRLDLGFDGHKEALLTFNRYALVIEINMSNDVAYVDNIMTYMPNAPFLYGCHNFYPQLGTGLPYDFFMSCTKRFKKYGLRTAAFITSHHGKIGPWDVNDGLCTLEMHRNLPINVQAKHLFATNIIDDVIIGNAYASEEELKALSLVNRYQLEFTIEVQNTTHMEEDIMFHEQHYRRGDITTQVIRSTEVRKRCTGKNIEPHDNTVSFHEGDILIGNNNFGKYKGELQIALQNGKDIRKNKVGRITKEELILLDFVNPWTKFKLRKKE